MAETITLGPGDGTLRLHTTRTGAAAKLGHDLIIEVKQWSASATPTEDGRGLASIQATAESGSCEVIEGSGGAKPLSDKDKRDIRQSINEKVLLADKFPQIRFESTAVDGMTIRGALSLAGTTRPWEIACALEGDRIVGRGSIVQTEYGLKIYSAMMGALKVGDAVGVSIDVKNPRA